ncbi:MAG: outer membrane beta-barrel protein [Ignavibacteriales bacterium]|nr:outer membrane beta-barrel protein [Ignavibacteriales bacterium]
MKRSINTFGLLCLGLMFVLSDAGAQMRSGKLGVGLSGIMGNISGDQASTSFGLGGGLSVAYSMTEYVSLRASAQLEQMGFKDAAGVSGKTSMFSGNGYLALDVSPNSTFNPYILAGGGYALFYPKLTGQNSSLGVSTPLDFHIAFGGGADIFFNEFWSVSAQGEYVLTGSKKYDGFEGSGKDKILRFSLQIRYYFFDQDFIAKLLDAQAERYEKKK